MTLRYLLGSLACIFVLGVRDTLYGIKKLIRIKEKEYVDLKLGKFVPDPKYHGFSYWLIIKTTWAQKVSRMARFKSILLVLALGVEDAERITLILTEKATRRRDHFIAKKKFRKLQ